MTQVGHGKALVARLKTFLKEYNWMQEIACHSFNAY